MSLKLKSLPFVSTVRNDTKGRDFVFFDIVLPCEECVKFYYTASRLIGLIYFAHPNKVR